LQGNSRERKERKNKGKKRKRKKKKSLKPRKGEKVLKGGCFLKRLTVIIGQIPKKRNNELEDGRRKGSQQVKQLRLTQPQILNSVKC
jgi:hypothetical protein